jgi:N-alpha-acetyl-L-2,4-diaminobutyrate deacetylase
MPDDSCFLFCEQAGMIEYLAELGDKIEQNQPPARIWPTDRTGIPPMTVHAKRGGILTARHVPGLVQMGDFISLIAVETM